MYVIASDLLWCNLLASILQFQIQISHLFTGQKKLFSLHQIPRHLLGNWWEYKPIDREMRMWQVSFATSDSEEEVSTTQYEVRAGLAVQLGKEGPNG